METVPTHLRADYIFSSLVLHHIKDTEHIFRCFFDVLNDNGHLIVVDLDPDDGSFHESHPNFDGHHGFEQAFLLALAAKVGFAKACAKTFYYGSKLNGKKESAYSLFVLDAIKQSPRLKQTAACSPSLCYYGSL